CPSGKAMHFAKARGKVRPPSPAPNGRALRWGLKTTALLVLVAGFLGGLIWLGRHGLEQIRGQDRYLVPFGDIECEPPEGLDRATFLGQVQYEARVPERLNVLDEELPRQLREAFARHPWVEAVDDVGLEPPRRI